MDVRDVQDVQRDNTDLLEQLVSKVENLEVSINQLQREFYSLQKFVVNVIEIEKRNMDVMREFYERKE